MILSGKTLADEIQEEIRLEVASAACSPGLAVVLIGDNPSSQAYVAMKKKACLSVGFQTFSHHLPTSTTESHLLELIATLNHDPRVDGILVQLPLPKHINPENIVVAIDPNKDVDGFHPINLGKLLLGHPEGFIPCTPLGIKILLERYHIPTNGQEVVIVGRSAIVGKPLAALLMQNAPGCNATVTVVHSQTRDLASHTRKADILVACLGSPQFITKEMVKEGVVVIDVGINRVSDSQRVQGYRIVGDVDYENVAPKCRAITPVPKGIGPMTVAMLLQNTLLSYQRKSL